MSSHVYIRSDVPTLLDNEVNIVFYVHTNILCAELGQRRLHSISKSETMRDTRYYAIRPVPSGAPLGSTHYERILVFRHCCCVVNSEW